MPVIIDSGSVMRPFDPPDPRDAEIARLRAALAERDQALADARAALDQAAVALNRADAGLAALQGQMLIFQTQVGTLQDRLIKVGALADRYRYVTRSQLKAALA